jgi:hypothetical protein
MGGTGQTFPWELAARAKVFKKPIFLAGGLTPSKTWPRPLRRFNPSPWTWPAASRNRPKRKDYDKMKQFIEEVKYRVLIWPRFIERSCRTARGYFGAYGGRFVPETLLGPLEELEQAFRNIGGIRFSPGTERVSAQKLCRSAHALVFCQKFVGTVGRAANLFETGRFVPHGRPQSKQHLGPMSAGETVGKKEGDRRNRRRPARGGDGHGLRVVGAGLRSLHGRRRHATPSAQCVSHAEHGRSGHSR